MALWVLGGVLRGTHNRWYPYHLSVIRAFVSAT